MKLVILIGNAAIGKMTVGQALMKIDNTNLSAEIVTERIKTHFNL